MIGRVRHRAQSGTSVWAQLLGKVGAQTRQLQAGGRALQGDAVKTGKGMANICKPTHGRPLRCGSLRIRPSLCNPTGQSVSQVQQAHTMHQPLLQHHSHHGTYLRVLRREPGGLRYVLGRRRLACRKQPMTWGKQHHDRGCLVQWCCGHRAAGGPVQALARVEQAAMLCPTHLPSSPNRAHLLQRPFGAAPLSAPGPPVGSCICKLETRQHRFSETRQRRFSETGTAVNGNEEECSSSISPQ